MEFFEMIGLNILDILEQKDMNQTDLATKMGVSKQVINKIVKGQKAINVFEIKNIAEILNVSIDRIIQQKEEENLEPTVLFMGAIKDENKKDLEFLSSVIHELIIMEETLYGQ